MHETGEGYALIESWHIREALRRRLGSALVDDPSFPDGLTALLRSYAAYKDTFAGMASRVEDVLFNALYDRLGASMSVRMDDGTVRRVRTVELKEAADDVMGVLFDQLKVYSVSYDALHAYCMESGSFSAKRTLYTRYGEFLSPSERTVLARVIRNSRTPADWQDWLPES